MGGWKAGGKRAPKGEQYPVEVRDDEVGKEEGKEEARGVKRCL